MEIAHDAAGETLVSGPKIVETVQAFLLLAVYPMPRKKWSDDRSWLYMGAAIRCEDNGPPFHAYYASLTSISQGLHRSFFWTAFRKASTKPKATTESGRG